MNLDQLSAPLPKPWLEIACDKLTCRSLVVEPGAGSESFSYYFNVGGGLLVVPTGQVSSIADTPWVSSPYYNAPQNIYTAPRALAISVSAQIIMSTTIGQNLHGQLELFVNGVNPPELISDLVVPGAVAGFADVIWNTAVLSLAQGDTVTWRFRNIGGANCVVNAIKFSGVVVS
jgi:hypothetical protein